VRTILPPLAALALCSLVACERMFPGPRQGTGRGVLLIAVDGLRADHVTGLG
jgi:hypothetical protein